MGLGSGVVVRTGVEVGNTGMAVEVGSGVGGISVAIGVMMGSGVGSEGEVTTVGCVTDVGLGAGSGVSATDVVGEGDGVIRPVAVGSNVAMEGDEGVGDSAGSG